MSDSKLISRRCLGYFRINVLIAYGVCLPLSLGAPWIIQVLFHKTYAQAAPIMAVYSWALVSVFLGVAGTRLPSERTQDWVLTAV